MRRSARTMVAVVAVLPGGLTLACDAAPPATVTSVSRDSAEVRIVRSEAPAWDAGEGWSVAEEPTWDLSGVDDETLDRPSLPRLLPDGRLFVYNGRACELRLYGPDRALEWSAGGCGDGPGEFRRVRAVAPGPGDSLLVIDSDPIGGTRATVLGPDRAVGRTARTPAPVGLPVFSALGILADGSVAFRAVASHAGRDSPGVETDAEVLALTPDPAAAPAEVGRFPGITWDYVDLGGRLGRGVLTFSGPTQFAVGDERLFVGFPDRYEIRVLDAGGALRQIWRRAFAPVPVTESDIDRLAERRLAEVEGEEARRIVRRAFRDMHHAGTMPAFGVPRWPTGPAEGGTAGGASLLAADTGHLWVFEHYRPGEYANRWSVFSPDGVWLGRLSLPDGLRPAQIGEDFVLGVWTDEIGFRHVRRHELVRPPRQPVAPR